MRRSYDHQDPERAAIQVLSQMAMDGNDTITVPVDVEQIAKKLGLQVEYRSFQGRHVDSLSGLLVRMNPGEPFRAVVNAQDSTHRQRFTLAHEIGHYVHKYSDTPEDDTPGLVEHRDELSSRGTDSEEIWANRFAAALLMPASNIMQLWGQGWAVTRIADFYNVSPEAVEHRLWNLGLHSVGRVDDSQQ